MTKKTKKMTQRRQASSSTFYNQIDVEVKQTLKVNAYRLLSKSKGETKQENMLSGHQDMNLICIPFQYSYYSYVEFGQKVLISDHKGTNHAKTTGS